MGTLTETNYLESAKSLMNRYAKRTGISSEGGHTNRRYLWTDSFALLNLLALKNLEGDQSYGKQALRLINEVHSNLGQFVPYDSRKGWISMLPEEEAKNHPTKAGLRIGKKLPERSEDECFDQRLEWERDGQYFHYHTRWIVALLRSGKHFGEEKFYNWAAELCLAGSNFIVDKGGGLSMYWKMSVDLSRPLVPMMGAHDPLEGLICALQAKELTEIRQEEFDRYIEQLKKLCDRSEWGTADSLGIGGLLLDVIRAAELHEKIELPSSIHPKKLLQDAEQGLKVFYGSYDPSEPANYRLAFRECGLSLGLRCLKGNLQFLKEKGLEPAIDTKIWNMAEEIEEFWLKEENMKASTFQDHLDINEVSLAASLLANHQPEVFTRL